MKIVTSRYRMCATVLFGALLILLLSSCASKFFKTKSVNLAPFAKQTLGMIGNLHYGLSDTDLLYLRNIRRYVEEPTPFKRYLALEAQVSRMLKGVVAYSLQVVSISEQNISVEKKNQALVDMLFKLRDFMSEDAVIPPPNSGDSQVTDENVEKIIKSETYIQALQHSQIFINSFKAFSGKLLDELKKEQRRVAKKIDVAIEKKYAVTIEFENEIRRVQERYYRALIYLSRYTEAKDENLITKMRALNIGDINELIKGKKVLQYADVRNIHKISTERLIMLGKNQAQIMPDINIYRKTRLELTKLLKKKSESIKVARLTFILWGQAHGRMAAGKLDPAEWFDVTDTGSLLFGAARSTVGL